jgi:hypothetical protein
MSRNFEDELTRLALKAGGSHKTRHDRVETAKRFHAHLQRHNIQVKSAEHIKTRYIVAYIEQRKTEVGLRTLQNEMAHIRGILESAGKTKLAASEAISNQKLGIGGASRVGTKTACPDGKYHEILKVAMSRDAGVAATLQLQRTFGLRAQEAVEASKSLKTWEKQIAGGRPTISLTYGSKGGRPREILVLDREKALSVVKNAMKVAKEHNGHLINKPNLKSAMYYYTRETRIAGLAGEHSNHSLRYAWAQDCMKALEHNGITREEALAQTSQYLGHGDGRGRYVERVYSR